MAKKTTKKAVRRPATSAVRKAAAKSTPSARKRLPTSARRPAPKPARKSATRVIARKTAAPSPRPLFAPVRDAESREVGGVKLAVGRVGAARVKRMIYPVGFRWSVDMKPVVGGDDCMHAHAGFLVHGEIHIEYPDGCVVQYKAPHIVAIDPGHDGWVVGKDPAVIIEFDFEGDTQKQLGMPDRHTHA